MTAAYWLPATLIYTRKVLINPDRQLLELFSVFSFDSKTNSVQPTFLGYVSKAQLPSSSLVALITRFHFYQGFRAGVPPQGSPTLES